MSQHFNLTIISQQWVSVEHPPSHECDTTISLSSCFVYLPQSPSATFNSITSTVTMLLCSIITYHQLGFCPLYNFCILHAVPQQDLADSEKQTYGWSGPQGIRLDSAHLWSSTRRLQHASARAPSYCSSGSRYTSDGRDGCKPLVFAYASIYHAPCTLSNPPGVASGS